MMSLVNRKSERDYKKVFSITGRYSVLNALLHVLSKDDGKSSWST